MRTPHASRDFDTPKPPAPHGFRESMDWVHTWSGLLFGVLLFAIFFMGTLSCFDREIDRWAQPASRSGAGGVERAALDAALPHLRELADPRATNWLIYPPSERVPSLRIGWSGGGMELQVRDLDPATGALRPQQGGAIGTRFMFPMHFSLHWKRLDLGYWLVGAAGMAMLVGIVSGVATHRRILKDFFTFRPGKPLQRSALDLHNWTAVLALPFHFAIALSGLVIFFGIYMKAGIFAAYGSEAEDRARFNREAFSSYTRPLAKQPLQTIAPLEAMVTQAQRRWSARGEPGEPGLVIVRNPRDANAVVDVRRAYRNRVSLTADTVWFGAADGRVLHEERMPAATKVQRWISGLHFIQFDHWPLRWLYFAMGAAGCAMLLTGTLVWCEKRRARHARHGRLGATIVEAINVAGTVGLIVATLAMLCANRLLPAGLADPLGLEMRVFFGVWIATLLHALVVAFVDGRTPARRHWAQQCAAVALLALAAVVLNAATTGDHLLKTLGSGMGAVAGVDLGLLATAGLAACVVQRLRRPTVPSSRRTAAPEERGAPAEASSPTGAAAP
ncbi:MAG TPA: PepSY-associated TM helix domain-containing protein [Methylibium sp.]|uniref:PepSY-associated TM helix domain-containing protein n=1 Tax=Methylibium sp. TaxID=2067992 RepID=UPI002DB9C729|nr:PepSY-associated TM helix domain-containing protein [Methylibium sp.]HEU4457588.1 PepSY-associated TM helix domain-containing protein [Methylibium sp.]